MKKKYYNVFQKGLHLVNEKTKEIIRDTVRNIPDRRLRKQVDEVIDLLAHGDGGVGTGKGEN